MRKTGNLNVAIIVANLNILGGIAQHVRSLSKWLKRKGINATIIEAPLVIKYPLLGNISAVSSLALRGFLERMLRRTSADIIHVHHILYYPPAKILGKPIVLTMHGIASLQYSLLRPTLNKIISKIELYSLKNAAAVTAVTPYIASYYSRLSSRRVDYVPNAIDEEDIPCMNGKYEEHENEILYVGRLSKEKGIDILLKAIPIIIKEKPNIKINIYGDGPLRRHVIYYADKFRNNIKFYGKQPRRKVLKALCRARMLVLPSRREGFPTVILEAFATHAPVIVSEIPELKGLFIPNRHIITIKPEPHNLAKKILLTVDDDKMLKWIANNAFELLKKKYLWSKVINEYINIYRKLC